MNRLRLLSLGLFLLFQSVSGFSFAQSVPFINYNTDARTAALGNTGYVLKSAFSVNRNAATLLLHQANTMEVASSYLSWQPQVATNKLLNVAALMIKERTGYGVGFRYNILKPIEELDGQGNQIGFIKPKECATDLSIAYKMNPSVLLGVTLRYLYSDLGGEKKAFAFASDVSVLYTRPKWNAGLGYTNLGTKLNYGNLAYNLPTRMIGGLAYRFLDKVNHTILASADIAYQFSPNSKGLAGGLGSEYTYKQTFSLRIGYHLESEIVGSSYATVGCGVYYKRFDLSFAFLQASDNNPVRQSLLVSLKKEL